MPKQDKTGHYKPANKRKTVVISLRVTPELRLLVERAAKQSKCRISFWATDRLESAAKKELA